MNRLLLSFFVCAGMVSVHAQGVYQIPNSDFEGNWTTQQRSQYTETTPDNWNSFYSAKTTSLTEMAFGPFGAQCGKLSKSPDAHSGNGAALITATQNMLGSISNGNLTTGIVNMGNMTADNPNNYNFSDMTSESGSCSFTGLPDGVRFWAKFASQDTTKGNASAHMILHTDSGYMDPSGIMGEDKERLSRIARAYQEIVPDTTWKEYTVAFEYNDNNLYQTYTGQKYLLASFSTNKTPGVGANGDALAIDDIQMLYYSELASLKFNGEEYFEAGKTSFEIPFAYDETALTCLSNGKGATISSSYDQKSALLTITVSGNNISEDSTNVHVYTVQFKSVPLSVEHFTNTLMVVVSGKATAPVEKTIDLITNADSTVSLALYDFEFNGLPVGDVIVNVTAEQDGDKTVYKGQQNIVVMGSMPALVDVTATVENGRMTAVMPIEVAGGAMHVDVTFAPLLTIDGETAVTVDLDGKHHVVISRQFLAGWTTLCVPFMLSVEDLGTDVEAQEFTSYDGNYVNFTKVTELEPNKPYLVYFPKESTDPVYLYTDAKSATPLSVTFGDFTFCGSYEDQMSMAGKYSVIDSGDDQKLMLGDEQTAIGPSFAYFTKSGEQIEEVPLKLDGKTTDIENVEQQGDTLYQIYNLQGIMVRRNATDLNGLSKGVYIVNGKKVLVK